MARWPISAVSVSRLVRRTLLVAASLLAWGLSSVSTGYAAGPAPIRIAIDLSEGARLGGRAAITVGMRVDIARLRSPVTDLQILTPRGLDVAGSGLGVATCQRPAAETTSVIVPNDDEVQCPRNSLLGSGTATAALLFPDDGHRPILGSADLRLFAGATQGDRPGLVLLVTTISPVTAQLSYRGELFTARRPYGLALRLRVPKIPQALFGIPLDIALSRMDVLLGGPEILYRASRHGRAAFYRPGGVVLPDRCPHSGRLRFRVVLEFLDGTSGRADAAVRCPPGRATRNATHR